MSDEIRKQGMSRRLFLGGAGVALALPALASLVGSRRHAARAADVPKPKRLLFVYVPNGIHMPSWTPAATGANWTSPILDDLGDMKAHALVLSGVQNLPGRPDGAGDHGAGTGAFLTCRKVRKTDGDDIQNGISVDQVAAQSMAGVTRYGSLELGLDGGGSLGGCDSGYSCAYTRNISWAGVQTPLPKIVNPRVVFDRLFAGYDPNETAEVRERKQRQKRSILDWVRNDATSLRGRVSASDRQKLDEYLTGVRELEARLDGAHESVCAPTALPPETYDLTTHLSLMADLIVTAFRCDLTRVVTFMLANAGSGRSYTFVDPTVTGGHHDISHHQSDPENFRKLEIINRWEIRQLAEVARRLHAEKDLDGVSLLDQTTMFFSSEIADGNAHTHTDLPVVLLGRGGGTLTPGRLVRTQQPMSNLFIALLNRFGVPATSFGDDGTAAMDLG
jgi:hypothetical protein